MCSVVVGFIGQTNSGGATVKLTYIRLLVGDYAASFRFYHDVMGFEPTWGDENSGYADFNTGDTTLALFNRAEMAQVVGTAETPSGLDAQDRSMLIFEAEDLDARVEQLQQRGANVVSPPRDFPDWGIRAAHLRDPDGYLIEINRPLAREQWSEELVAESQGQK